MTDFYLDGPDYDFDAVLATLPAAKIYAAESTWPPLSVRKIVQQGNGFSAHVHNQRGSWTTIFSIHRPLPGHSYYDPLTVNSGCDCGRANCVHLIAA